MAEAIRFALSETAEFEVVGVAGNADDGSAMGERLGPDVVLVDLRLPGSDGFELLSQFRASNPRARLVVLSGSDEPEVIDLALRSGACAFISKRIDPHDLAAALRQALDQTLFQPFRSNPLIDVDGAIAPPLTERERAVLRAVADGCSNKEIAEQLSYAEQTVKLDLSRVYRKLGVSSRTEAMAVAYRKGLIDARVVELAAAKP